MTDKQTFLEKLNAALLERGISPSDIEPYLERFDRFYDRMVTDDAATSSALDDINTIADNISAQISNRYDEMNRLAERTMTVQAVKSEDIQSGDEALADDDEDSDEFELVEAVDESAVQGGTQDSDGDGFDGDDGYSTKLPDYVGEEKVQDSKMFWILFAISLPLTALLMLALLSIFVAVWAGLAAVIIAAVAVLVATVTVGTAASLIGIIYGVIQLFTSVPVGLYEIGIGVVVAGVVMFAGILLYNFAVRLIPWLIKLVGRLFRFVLKKLRVLFNFLRRECAKL